MKSLLVLIVFIFSVSLMAQDEFELNRIKLDLGKGSVTSGYDVTLIFTKGSQSLSITGNHSRVYGVFGEKYDWVTPAISGGFFKNAPWIGPRLTINPISGVSFLFWYAISAGKPDHPDDKINVFIRYNSVYVTIWKITISGATCKFVDDKTNYYPGIAFNDKLNGLWNYKIAVDYDVNNKEPLFQFGLSYSVK